MGIGANVQKIAQEKKVSLKELSRRAGIPYTTVYNMVKRDSDRVSPENVQKLADALNVGIGELYGLALIDKMAKIATPEMIKNIHQIAKVVAQDTTVQDQCEALETAFCQLNDIGREEAIKRVQELTQLSQYSCSEQSEIDRFVQILTKATQRFPVKINPDEPEKVWLNDDVCLTKEQISFLWEQFILNCMPENLNVNSQNFTKKARDAAGDVPGETEPKKD